MTKIDDGPALVREVHETSYIAETIGSDATRVLRGPVYSNDKGEIIDMEYDDQEPLQTDTPCLSQRSVTSHAGGSAPARHTG